MKKSNPNLKRRQYLQELDWHFWLRQALILNDAVEILRNYNPEDTSILTKVHSLQEATAKLIILEN